MRRWMPLWIIPVLILMAVGTIWLRLTIVRTTYAINQVDKQLRNLRQEREKAALKLTGLRSPRRLELLARAKFGLNRPKADQVVHMK
jgi:cell division protein FtsL